MIQKIRQEWQQACDLMPMSTVLINVTTYISNIPVDLKDTETVTGKMQCSDPSLRVLNNLDVW